jgi:hypothetical protein
MRGKKTAQLAYRLSEEEKAAITEIAGELRMKPAEIVSILMAQFIQARRKYGNRLIWPPEFNYFPTVPSKQDQLLAAESPEN